MLNQEKCANGRQFMRWVFCSGCISNVTVSDLKKPLRNTFQVYFLPIMLVLSIHFLSVVAGAAEVKLTPKLAVGGAYDDNILFTTDDKVNSSIVTVSPRPRGRLSNIVVQPYN